MEYNDSVYGSGAPVTQEEKAAIHRQKSTTAMILSIIGLAVFFLPVVNIAGLVLSVIGLVRSRKSQAYARENGIPECGENSAAFICGIVGIILNVIVIFALLCLMIAFGWLFVRTASYLRTGPGFPAGGFAVSDAAKYLFRMVV